MTGGEARVDARNDRREGPSRDGRTALGRLSRRASFVLVAGAAGAASSIVLTLSTGFAQSLPARFPWLLLALPVLGALSVGLYRLLRLPAALTTEGVVDELRAGRRVPGSLTVGILGGSCLTLLGGGSVGMEAGALQMGASTGSVLGRAFKLPPARGRDGASDGYPGAIGMAAAFSALFFAPLGSCMFVLELVRFDRAVLRHAPAMLAAALVAYAIARAVGIGDHIPRVALPGLSWAVAAHCLLVGLCCAVGGALFAACLRALRRAMRRRAKARPFALVAVGGLAFAGIVLACGWQAFQGTGMGLLRGALAGSAAPADFAVKAGLTVLVLGFGFKGGEIMPMFSIGALLGCSLGLATGAPAGFSAALGMAAFFAAAGRCPLTALLRGAEICGWLARPFLLIAVATTWACSAAARQASSRACAGVRGATSRRSRRIDEDARERAATAAPRLREAREAPGPAPIRGARGSKERYNVGHGNPEKAQAEGGLARNRAVRRRGACARRRVLDRPGREPGLGASGAREVRELL